CVHKKFDLLSNGLARSGHALDIACWFPSDLHFYEPDPLGGPAAELPSQLSIGIRSKAAAAIARHRVTRLPQQRNHWQSQGPGFHVPQGNIDRGNCHRSNSGASQIADGGGHFPPGLIDGEAISVFYDT